MARFTLSQTCPVDNVDETVNEIVSLKTRDDASASYEGQTVLISVTIVSLPEKSKSYGKDWVLVTCVLGNQWHDL